MVRPRGFLTLRAEKANICRWFVPVPVFRIPGFRMPVPVPVGHPENIALTTVMGMSENQITLRQNPIIVGNQYPESLDYFYNQEGPMKKMICFTWFILTAFLFLPGWKKEETSKKNLTIDNGKINIVNWIHWNKTKLTYENIGLNSCISVCDSGLKPILASIILHSGELWLVTENRKFEFASAVAAEAAAVAAEAAAAKTTTCLWEGLMVPLPLSRLYSHNLLLTWQVRSS